MEMVMKVTLIAIIALTTFILNTTYAKDYPSDVDLKTAYCITENNRTISLLSKVVNINADTLPSTPYNNAQKDLMNTYLKLVGDLRRMQAYLIPKLKYLDTNSLQLAVERAKKDADYMIACGDKCTPKYIEGISPDFTKIEKCRYSCDAEQGNPSKRLASCEKVDWLPY
jgi:hypothetical protein